MRTLRIRFSARHRAKDATTGERTLRRRTTVSFPRFCACAFSSRRAAQYLRIRSATAWRCSWVIVRLRLPTVLTASSCHAGRSARQLVRFGRVDPGQGVSRRTASPAPARRSARRSAGADWLPDRTRHLDAHGFVTCIKRQLHEYRLQDRLQPALFEDACQLGILGGVDVPERQHLVSFHRERHIRQELPDGSIAFPDLGPLFLCLSDAAGWRAIRPTPRASLSSLASGGRRASRRVERSQPATKRPLANGWMTEPVRRRQAHHQHTLLERQLRLPRVVESDQTGRSDRYEAAAMGLLSLARGVAVTLPLMLWWYAAPPDLGWLYGEVTRRGHGPAPWFRCIADRRHEGPDRSRAPCSSCR